MNSQSSGATYNWINIGAQKVNNVYFERKIVGRGFFAPLFSLQNYL